MRSSEDLEDMLVHEHFIKFAENSYSHVAPQNMYGKVGLEMSFSNNKQNFTKLNTNACSLHPESPKPKEFACIYRGVDTATKRTYTLGKQPTRLRKDGCNIESTKLEHSKTERSM